MKVIRTLSFRSGISQRKPGPRYFVECYVDTLFAIFFPLLFSALAQMLLLNKGEFCVQTSPGKHSPLLCQEGSGYSWVPVLWARRGLAQRMKGVPSWMLCAAGSVGKAHQTAVGFSCGLILVLGISMWIAWCSYMCFHLTLKQTIAIKQHWLTKPRTLWNQTAGLMRTRVNQMNGTPLTFISTELGRQRLEEKMDRTCWGVGRRGARVGHWNRHRLDIVIGAKTAHDRRYLQGPGPVF